MINTILESFCSLFNFKGADIRPQIGPSKIPAAIFSCCCSPSLPVSVLLSPPFLHPSVSSFLISLYSFLLSLFLSVIFSISIPFLSVIFSFSIPFLSAASQSLVPSSGSQATEIYSCIRAKNSIHSTWVKVQNLIHPKF